MDLTNEEKQLLKASRKTADGDAARHRPWATTITKELGISLETCERILGELQKKGLITLRDEGFLSFQLTPSGVEASES
jgi:predicted transcriptional regulator